MLPSQCIAEGNTFDMYVLDVATRWVKYQQQEAEGNQSVTKKSSKQPTEKELLEMMEKVRNKGAKRGS